jgi:hypothetical protein
MLKYVTPELILKWEPCDKYDTDSIRKLFGRRQRATVQQILEAPIPVGDAFWVVLRKELIPAKTLRLFACACAERALKRERNAGREPDARSWEAVKTSRRYARGKATAEELAAAWAAARAAAWDAARDAARAAAWAAGWAAAGAAAWAAGWDAARDAEYQWQKRALLRLLGLNRKGFQC